MVSFSDTVREAIAACGLTRYAIAKQTGISEGMLSRFMSGERDMTLHTLQKIAPVIGVKLVMEKPVKSRQTKGR